jgi:hypothetical protein
MNKYPELTDVLSASMVNELNGIVGGNLDRDDWEDLIDVMESAPGRPVFYTKNEDRHHKIGFVSEADIENAVEAAIGKASTGKTSTAMPRSFVRTVITDSIWQEVHPVSTEIIERVQLAMQLLKKWSTPSEAPAKTRAPEELVICHPFSLSETSCYLVFGCGADIPSESKDSLLKTIRFRPIEDHISMKEFNSVEIPDEIWRGEDKGCFYNQVEADTTPDQIVKVSPELIKRAILRLTPNKLVILEVCLKGSLAIPVNLMWATTCGRNQLVAYVEAPLLAKDKNVQAINNALEYIGKDIGASSRGWSGWSREYLQVPLPSSSCDHPKGPATGFVSTISLLPTQVTFDA